MKTLPAALGWLGIVLIFGPLALACAAMMFLIAPWLGLFALVFLVVAVRDRVKAHRGHVE